MRENEVIKVPIFGIVTEQGIFQLKICVPVLSNITIVQKDGDRRNLKYNETLLYCPAD